MTVHRYSVDTDRCTCGGVVTYLDDGDRDGEVGEGCEVADAVSCGLARGSEVA